MSDIVKLSKSKFATKAFSDHNLYKTIVDHRYKIIRVGCVCVDYNKHQPQTTNPISLQEIIEAWRTDYNIMIERVSL